MGGDVLCVDDQTHPSAPRANPSHLTRRICRFRRNSFPPSSVRFNTAASMYGFSLCLRRGPCAECASRARAVAGLSCGSETFGERAGDAGRDAHGCGAAQPAAVDGRRVRTAASERADAGAIQARQVSSRVWKLWTEKCAEGLDGRA